MDINTVTREAVTEVRKSDADFKNANECARYIKQHLLIIVKNLVRGNINIQRPCTDSDDDTCWLLRNLSLWNDILHFVDLEVREEETGKVTLRSIEVEILMTLSTNSVIRAALAVYILLKSHRCVVRLNLINDIISQKYPFLLARGLYFNQGLRHVKIVSSPVPELFGEELSVALKRMSGLGSVEIGKIKLSRNAAGNIADMVQRNRHLTSVSLMENGMTEAGTMALIRSLTYCKVLSTVCISDTCLEERGAETLSRILSMSRTITELSLKFIADLNKDLFKTLVRPLKDNVTLQKIEFVGGGGGSLSKEAIESLAKVLKRNKSLQFLHIVDFNITHDQGEVLSDILEDSETLLELHLQDNNLGNEGAQALVRGIKQNRTLQVLRLDSNKIGIRGIKHLATALQKNTTLQKLILGHYNCRSDDEGLFLTRTLRATNALDRMQLSYDVSGFLELVASLKTTKCIVTEVNVDASLELDSGHVRELFRTLIHVQGLKTVIFDAPVPFDDEAAVKVAKFLAVCQTVTRFHLNTTNTEITVFPILAQGLKRNTSIEHLEMEYCAKDGCSAFAFFDLLKENCNIKYFSYLKTNLHYLQMLPEEMNSNYTLATLKVYEEADFKQALLEVYEKQRRNVSLMNRAVEFILNHRVDRRMAEAYEKLRDTKCLRTRLKDAGGMRDEDIEARFKSARSFIIEHYLPITRIVKRSLVCHKAAVNTQIDRLDYHTWLHIFSYLNVCDVVDA